MKLYTEKLDTVSARKIIADDMILTKNIPTCAGSRMLSGYVSLFEAEVLTRLFGAGYELSGKSDVGEFAIDLLGESSYNGACVSDGKLVCAAAEILKSGDAMAAITLDVNGSVRRAAAQSGLVGLKPTYGTVSRFGTIPAVCSGECVSVLSETTDGCIEILDVIAGHDDKDGTSLSADACESVKYSEDAKAPVRIALLKSMTDGIDESVRARIEAFAACMRKNGVEVCEIDDTVIAKARIAWNILMCAELCNNVSRYDGVKYGYRTENFTNLDELYTNSRTEAFGALLKSAIIFGSETLSTENYMKVYDKALRCRRVISEQFSKLFESFDAVLMPACSTMEYTEDAVKENKYMCFEENFYTAPASITGLPAVVCGGVQLVGKAFSEAPLFAAAKIYEKEGK